MIDGLRHGPVAKDTFTAGMGHIRPPKEKFGGFAIDRTHVSATKLTDSPYQRPMYKLPTFPRNR